MPSLKAFIPKEDAERREQTLAAFNKVVGTISGTNLVFIDVELAVEPAGKSAPFLEIHSPIGGLCKVRHLIMIANTFLPILDVELYHPNLGIMLFRMRGREFEDDCFAFLENGP